MKNGSFSIAEEANRSVRRIVITLTIPLVIAMLMTLAMSVLYGRATRRMEREAALEPTIETDIPESIWSAVAGRVSYAECGAAEQIESVNEELDQLILETTGSQLELVVARRTMGTLADYTAEIGAGLADGKPIAEMEKLLDEVRSVAQLIKNMLSNCIMQEVDEVAALNRSLFRFSLVMFLIELAILLMSIRASVHIRRDLKTAIHEPISRLEEVTGQLASGNLRARAALTDAEELRGLTAGVNIMANRLQELIAQNRMEQENLKKAELRTLQAQINPHFLYNTLDAIVWKAEAGDEEEVIHLTRALSDFFRISLSSGADWITISQEKKHIAGYLSIQKTRYRDILNYEIDIPDEIGSYYILKLLLQPLVENALYHGIKYRRGGGRITVRGEKQGEELVFSVQDTGKGMDPETLANIRERMSAPEPAHETGTNGFGLINVNLRIRLYYNQPEGLKIESGPEGTTVSLRVPCRKQEGMV